MMPYQSYQLWNTERTKTRSEQHEADARRGQLAAVMSRSSSRTVRRMRGLTWVGNRRLPSATPDAAAVRLVCAGVVCGAGIDGTD